MGAKAERQKGDGLTVRQRSRRFLVKRLREGATEVPRRLGNGVMHIQALSGRQ